MADVLSVKTHPTRISLSLSRAAMTGAFSTLWLYVLAWAWAAFGLPGSEAFLSLFTSQLTTQPAGSVTTLWVGGLCAFLVGGIFGAIVAHCYDLAGRVLRL